MEVESKDGELPLRSIPTDQYSKKRNRRKLICLSVIAAVFLVVLIIIILAFTVFKAKSPITTVNSVSLRDFDVSVNIIPVKVSLNITLDVDISITNPNRVGFKYTNSSGLVRYRGDVVGEVPIPSGSIGSDETKQMNLTLTVLADRLLSNSNLYSDVVAGSLPLSTSTRISGKVHKLFNIHVVSYTNCDLILDVSSRTITKQTCHYRTKI